MASLRRTGSVAWENGLTSKDASVPAFYHRECHHADAIEEKSTRCFADRFEGPVVYIYVQSMFRGRYSTAHTAHYAQGLWLSLNTWVMPVQEDAVPAGVLFPVPAARSCISSI